METRRIRIARQLTLYDPDAVCFEEIRDCVTTLEQQISNILSETTNRTVFGDLNSSTYIWTNPSTKMQTRIVWTYGSEVGVSWRGPDGAYRGIRHPAMRRQKDLKQPEDAAAHVARIIGWLCNGMRERSEKGLKARTLLKSLAEGACASDVDGFTKPPASVEIDAPAPFAPDRRTTFLREGRGNPKPTRSLDALLRRRIPQLAVLSWDGATGHLQMSPATVKIVTDMSPVDRLRAIAALTDSDEGPWLIEHEAG
jgi:hypothetical protein